MLYLEYVGAFSSSVYDSLSSEAPRVFMPILLKENRELVFLNTWIPAWGDSKSECR